jgi:glycosyltransferase involved in cell wall biosynthesis
MRPYLEKAAVFVAPMLYGSGIQNKVLESMSMEVPVVTNNLVADGLFMDSYGEPPVYKAENDDEFAAGLVYLLSNTRERERLAHEGRRFVKNHFNWLRSAQILEKLCEKAVNTSSDV